MTETQPKITKNVIINIVKIDILNPETKIIVIKVETNNKVCPRSGWFIKKSIIINSTAKEYRYLL